MTAKAFCKDVKTPSNYLSIADRARIRTRLIAAKRGKTAEAAWKTKSQHHLKNVAKIIFDVLNPVPGRLSGNRSLTSSAEFKTRNIVFAVAFNHFSSHPANLYCRQVLWWQRYAIQIDWECVCNLWFQAAARQNRWRFWPKANVLSFS